MQYWAFINGEQKGPMDLDQLLALNITHETLVWREGLETWIPAKELSELSTILVVPAANEIAPPPLVTANAEHQEAIEETTSPKGVEAQQAAGTAQAYPKYTPGQQPYSGQQFYQGQQQSHGQQQFHGQQPYQGQTPYIGQQPYPWQNIPPCPPTNLVWAILSLIFCCQVFGIVAIIYAAQVTSLYNTGKYNESLKASNNAIIWSIVSLVTGIIGGIILISLNFWDAITSL